VVSGEVGTPKTLADRARHAFQGSGVVDAAPPGE
jgi:hypothetical protein